ncbi:Secretory carrier membrane protein family protein, partial [Prunus dulcis]
GFVRSEKSPFSVRFEPAGWGAAMEDLHSLLDMRGWPSIFVWEVRCKSAALLVFVSQIWGREISHPFYSLRLRLPSFLLANICILCLQVLEKGIESHRLAQLEYTKRQGTRHLHSAVIFKLGYTKRQGTRHLDSAIIFEIELE